MTDDKEGQSGADQEAESLNTEPTQDVTPAEGETSDTESWRENQKVPYSRFEDVVRKNQLYDGKISELTEQIQQLSELVQKVGATPQSAQQPTGSVWDERAKSAKSWDDFVSLIQNDTIDKWENRQKEEQEKADKALDQEIRGLRYKGISDPEINEAMKFAVKKADETGTYIPLAVAVKWLAETKTQPMQENKQATAKIQSSAKSKGGPAKSGEPYTGTKNKSLDEIVMEAKEKAPKIEA